MKQERALAWIAFAVVCIVWGTTYLAIRIALETIPPLLLTGARFVTAGLIMLAVAKLRGDAIPRDRRTLLTLAFVGILLVAVGNLAVVWAEQWVPSGLAALLVATSPFWMMIIEAFRSGGERVDRRGLLGMIIGFGGVAALVMPGASGVPWSLQFLLGALAIQVGGAAWQFGSAVSKYRMKSVAPVSSSALQMLFGGIVVTVIGLAAGEASRFTLTPKTFGALAYLTIFGSVIAYSAYVYALNHMSTTHTSLYAYVNPVVAVFLGWLILSEPLTWISITAMIVILGSVAMVQMRRKRPATLMGVRLPARFIQRDSAGSAEAPRVASPAEEKVAAR